MSEKNNEKYEINIFGKESSLRLKGLLVIMMFWGHMFSHNDRLWDGISWISIGKIAGHCVELYVATFFHIAVPMFFFIGGYGFYVTHKEGLQSRKISKQICKMYKKYWMVFCVFIPICIVAGIIKFNVGEFFLNFIGISSSYCGEWWFFSTYIEIILFWGLIIYFTEKYITISCKRNLFFAILSIGLMMLGYLMKVVFNIIGIDINALLIHEFYYFMIKQPFFVLGYLIAKIDILNYIYKKVQVYSSKWLFIFLIMLLTIVLPFTPLVKIPESIFYIFYIPLFALSFIYTDRIVPVFVNKIFLEIGNNSTYMWLIHSLLLYKLIQPIIYFFRVSVLIWIFFSAIVFVVSRIMYKFEFIIENKFLRQFSK